MAEGGSMDLGAHRATYDRFVAMFKWGAVAVALVAFIVVWIIAS